jgi:hypothetical protein
MADNIEGAPGIFTFISERPRFRQIAQESVECSGRAREKRDRVIHVMFHRAPRFVEYDF